MHAFLQLVLCLVAFVHVARSVLPTEVDWRKKGYVTRVKNQGPLESGWAFSVTGALEGQHKRNTDHLVALSEQQLIDCATGAGPVVAGFSRVTAFEYIIQNGGIDVEITYPYENRKGACRFNPRTVGAKATDRADVVATELGLQQAVAQFGPMSVIIDGSLASFQNYTFGVYDDPRCSNAAAAGNHAVLVVGYGETKLGGRKYWIVKNSRGPFWGENGYIRMSRDKNNQCGIANSAMFALAPKP